jgi:outer membrane protein assembly factor BamB
MKTHGRVAWLARRLVVLAVGCAVSAALISTGSCGAAQQQVPAVPTFAARKGGQLAELAVPKPLAFTTPDGRRGWKQKIPGGRPLTTPAVAGGVLYVGGGFGSHEFYALDARTGARVWSFRTGDDGPTAAVVDEGCVTYNTESCTLFVHDARTGKLLWHRWLGDPLMSQPAIGDGRLFMAYPGKDRSHHLVCFELRTGKVLWDQRIAAEVITAPVLDGSSVHVATADGTLYRFDAKTGKLLWSSKCNVTSAPRIVGGKVYISQRAVKTIEIVSGKGKDARKTKSESTVEGFNVADAGTGKLAFAEPQATVRAAYLLDPRRAYAAEIGNAGNAYSGQVAYRSMIPLDDWAAGYASHRQIAVSVKRLEELRKRAAAKDPTAAAAAVVVG